MGQVGGGMESKNWMRVEPDLCRNNNHQRREQPRARRVTFGIDAVHEE